MASSKAKYINRELSWLEFNQRVLEEAQDSTNPLLERLKFLAITGSNLDEFFMVRVGGLQMLAEASDKPDPSGLTPRQQLKAIAKRARKLITDQYRCFHAEIEPRLADQGIVRILPDRLSQQQSEFLHRVFEEEILPVLSPIAVRADQELPLLINQTINVAVQLAPRGEETEPRYAIIPFGRTSYRFITLPTDRGYAYQLLEDAIYLFTERFFEGEEIVDSATFRITRNADFAVREDAAADLLSQMQKVLVERKQGDYVRLEIADDGSSSLREFLQQKLGLDDEDVYRIPGPLDLASFMRLTELQGFDLIRAEPWPPQPAPAVDPTVSVFKSIAQHDVLLMHPYERFDPVVRFLEEAADDPDVLAIKQILYRTSRNSPIVAALKRAAERGKYVTAIVELKARFDEARNIEWAKALEQAEVQVIYGVKGLKTHAKLCIVVRREPQGIVRYMHFGTGNYNEMTARLYTDVGLMTCDVDLAADATSFFNTITGYSQPQPYRKLEAAPLGLRDRILEMIDAEVERCRHKQKGAITAKINALVDPRIIDALYNASQAGVKIRLCVRGVCCLRPGVPGLSDNISVVSIVDRFLEHSRILHFRHGGDDRVFISSADWMPRNLDRRVELLVPVESEPAKQRLIRQLELCFEDNVKARKLTPEGAYKRQGSSGRRKPIRCQEVMYEESREAVKQAERAKPTVFEPHRAPESHA